MKSRGFPGFFRKGLEMVTQANVLEEIINADMILAGIGEEFNRVNILREKEPAYQDIADAFENHNMKWMLPAYQEYLRQKHNISVKDSLEKLASILKDKNYFIVSASTNSQIYEIPWKREQFVMPCGSSIYKQCSSCNDSEILRVTSREWEEMVILFDRLSEEYKVLNKQAEILHDMKGLLGNCSLCDKKNVLNNVYYEQYNEASYVDKWKLYTKWLAGSINRKLVILELGVGMQFPTVIRFPFEKVTFFNQKAKLFRVNGTLYQMTEELKEKGISIPENAIDWLMNL